MPTIQMEKTIYDKPSSKDGKRILVMRFWPRGVKKEKVDLWLKEVGTDPKLIREWKSGKLAWAEYEKRYYRGMNTEPQRKLVREIAGYARDEPITLLCSCKDPNRCHRSLLKKLVKSELSL